MQWKNHYLDLQLNNQQTEAVKAVDGPVLLLAVPGSGKTTVLVSRLGYMVYGLGIEPENILTLTYTVAATRDMSRRFRKFFGEEDGVADRMEFRTINGICASIINQYGRMIGKTPFQLVTEEKSTAGMLSAIYRQVEGTFATESDLKTIRTWIAYIKNMMLSLEEIQDLNEEVGMNIADIYKAYNQQLKKEGLMDYDDQMIYAYTLLRKIPGLLDSYQERYRYILVDEAQDTSKIQHAIIALLVSKYENLFMVGDEDQSIYGFRAAYPEALLEFEKQHRGAKVLLMEDNFRSNALIVQAADQFIQKNILRHEKHMRATKAEGLPIQEISLKGRMAQYRYLVKVAAGSNEKEQETAVLYRDNESVLPLVDLLERQQIPYRMRNADLTFFSHRIVMDIVSIIQFAKDPCNTELFQQIYYKIGTYLNKMKAFEACEISEREQIPVLDAAIRFGHLPGITVGNLKSMKTHLENLLTDQAEYAITRIVQFMGYGEYLERMKLSDNKIFILKALAKQETDPIAFVEHLETLSQVIREKENDYSCPFILSTIHASKGLEYDTVYLLDVADGIFPEHVPAGRGYADDQERDTYEEERRLFYVGVTRAKEKLCLFKTGFDSVFQTELMGGYRKTVGTSASYSKVSRVKDVSSASLQKKEKVKATDQYYKMYLQQLGEGLFIVHKKYGRGAIMDINDDKITIMFDDKPRTLDIKICYKSRLLEIE